MTKMQINKFEYEEKNNQHSFYVQHNLYRVIAQIAPNADELRNIAV